ncbi:MAG TPA: type II toxin-antitoxin system RelE/ParE family toxin [Rhizomicrobium sp.]|nr:type II toxin-antitoxin system RelE/ParE family toxin [Rhizomicrobium sp.]
MPQLQIIISVEARADLLQLERYIAERDGELRAELILGRIWETIRTLAFMPGLGSPRPYLNRKTRAFPSPPWLIVYAPLPSLDGIRIVRVVDGRRDLPAVLGPKRRR